MRFIAFFFVIFDGIKIYFACKLNYVQKEIIIEERSKANDGEKENIHLTTDSDNYNKENLTIQ